MRIIGFSKKWPKLDNGLIFTTFRYPRRDRDWEIEEVVQVVYKPRTKMREALGIARIIRKQPKDTSKDYYGFFFKTFDNDEVITPSEAYEDGFSSMGHGDVKAMLRYIKQPGRPPLVNKLTLYWLEKEEK